MTDYFEKIAPSLEEARDSLSRINRRLSLLRLVFFAAAAALIIAGAVKGNSILLYIGGAASALVFICLCVIHKKSKYMEQLLNEKIASCKRYLARIDGDFGMLEDDGSEFADHSHPYASDLDIFGPHSVFALYNTSHSVFGRKAFADNLKGKHFDLLNAQKIKGLQKIVKALADDPEFLLDYESIGALHPITKVPDALITLCSKNEKLGSGLKLLWKIIPFIWLAVPALLIFGLTKYIRIAVLCIMLINIVIWFLVSKLDLSDIFKSGLISKQAEAIKNRTQILLDEEKRLTLFVPDYLDPDFPKHLDALIRSCSLCSLREQPITALLLNALMPYDLMCADRLYDWSVDHGRDFMANAERLGQIESLMCSAVPGLISKESCFPEIEENKKAFFDGVDMSHPLLDPSKVVSNSVCIDSQTALITGSNMSGKTTLIRTVGLMSVLAYTGAMVPARKVKCSIMKIYTSMRIADSLEENMSTFKAELVRIASIVKASEEEDSMLFLIDEVFRGTNSQDRTDGAEILLRKLDRPYISGFMTTHDYALCDRVAEQKMVNIVFCHFSERYEGDEVIFDYKLRDGMSHESNAKFLMKLVGII